MKTTSSSFFAAFVVAGLRRVPSPGLVSVICLMVLFFSTGALAETGGGGLPWESPLERLSSSFSGPVAYTISLLGIIASIAGLIWGSDISGFLRTMVILVLIISVLVFANSLLRDLFGASATVPGELLGDPAVLKMMFSKMPE